MDQLLEALRIGREVARRAFPCAETAAGHPDRRIDRASPLVLCRCAACSPLTLRRSFDRARLRTGIRAHSVYTFACGLTMPPIDGEMVMNNNLRSITRTLHALLKALPALRQHATPETVGRHVALIAHFQARYDRLAKR